MSLVLSEVSSCSREFYLVWGSGSDLLKTILIVADAIHIKLKDEALPWWLVTSAGSSPVTMEPFCRLLGASVRQKNPFVLVTLLSQMFSSHVCLLYGGAGGGDDLRPLNIIMHFQPRQDILMC